MIKWEDFYKSKFFSNADVVIFRWPLVSGDYEVIWNTKGKPLCGKPYYLNPQVTSFGVSIIGGIKKVIVTFGN